MRIIAGAALLAALTGAGITALDYPWQMNVAKRGRDDAGRRVMVSLALAARPSSPAPLPTATPAAQGSAEAPKAAPAPKAERAAAPRHASRRPKRAMPPPAQAVSGDRQYQREVAACEAGLAGLVCREKLKWRLCRDRWQTAGQPGAGPCRVGAGEEGWRAAGG
ncbi:MAG: hypothetical protein ACM3Y9_14355 [Ignavibacteria bacterium]